MYQNNILQKLLITWKHLRKLRKQSNSWKNPTKDNKDINKTRKRNNDSNNSKKGITSKTNTGREKQVSDSD